MEQIKISNPENIDIIHFTIEDGCEMSIKSDDGKPGWHVDLPGGIEVTCPHGFKAGVSPIA